MAFLWRNEYLTGAKEIDREHKKLVNLIDDLGKLIKEDRLDIRKAKRGVVLLGAYVRTHLSYEEEWMVKHGCQLNERSKDINKEFLSLYKILRNKVEKREPNRDLLEILFTPAKSWLIDHMNITNKTIRKALEAEALNPQSSILVSQIQKQSQGLN